MGRYIASGLATVIYIRENKNSEKVKDKEQILKGIGKKIDLNLYDVKEYDNGYELYLKTDMVNKHLKDFVKELTMENYSNTDAFTLNDYYDSEKDIWDNDFEVKINEKNNYELYLNNKKINEDEYLGFREYFNFVYLPEGVYDNFAYFIEIKLLYLGLNIDKFMPELDPYILYLMNPDLKTFKNPLSTAFIYGIRG